MINRDKIFELLQKESLTEEEKLLLDELTKNNEEAAEFARTYKKLNNLISSSSHLSYEEIGDYILFKNELPPEDKNVIKRVPKIEEHLRSCTKCSEEFKNLNSEFNDIETFIGSELYTQEKAGAPSSIIGKRKIHIYRYAFLSVLFLGIMYGLMFTVSKFSAPEYYDLAVVNTPNDFYATRGRATGDFLKSLNALDEGNINEAIKDLKNDIKSNPDDKTIFYSYYILGLTYLDNANRNFIGLFPHFNSYYAEQAVKNLQIALQKNRSGNYRNITLDTYFYLAKADIMIGRKKEAKENLMTVIREKGSKMNEAKQMLNVLE